jgi:DNA-directed RNA polymerase
MLMRPGVENPFPEVFKPCIYLSDLIWEAIGEVVASARVCMDWLREIARICMRHDVTPMWSSPSGFLVKQLYEKQSSYEVKTSIGDKIRRHRLQHGRGEASPRKHINGMCPNFVHALDAALKALVVNLSASAGVSQFAMVHDAYATTAKHSGTLATATRQCTVQMFTPNLLEQFRKEIEMLLPVGVELPDHPPLGNLDINEVMNSDYYFS